jgi:hypothetical protein
MKVQNKKNRNYIAPVIERVELDNEISLTLDSTPPTFETSNKKSTPEYFNNNPLKTNVS